MSDYFTKPTPIRVPVRLVNGQWEFFYGGAVPAKDGAIGDLILQKESLTDREFLRALRKRTEHRILEAGTALMVALSVRESAQLPKALQDELRQIESKQLSDEYYATGRPGGTRFVRITVGKPSESFSRRRPGEPGGVLLQLEGTIPKGVVVSSVCLPPCVEEKPLDSLNHAFTRLSEAFESWRLSHTGNIYERVLYQEKNGKWYPLDRLRRAAEATEEHELIRERWSQLMSLFSEPLDP